MEKDNRHIIGNEPDEITLLKYIRNQSSEEEIRWIEDWLKDNEEGERVLLQLVSIDYALTTQKRITSRNSLEAYYKVEKLIKQSQKRTWMNRARLVAACFLGLLIMSAAISFWFQNDLSEKTQIVTIQANAGMRTHFDLPDGSIAYLNSGSQLSYPFPFDKRKRCVTLTGEAYFKVAHNAEQPFIVSVANDRMRVHVVGTEFNLQSYEGECAVQTTLISGSVNIEMIRNGHIVSDVNLKPSEKAVYDITSGSVSISMVNPEYDIAWKEGRLIFKDMPLPQVLKKLSYFYNVRFEVKDSVINSYCFTGTFENKQLSQILDYLKISSNIDYTINHVKSDDSLGVQYTTVVLQKK